jgi:uncharacterized pyridoxamine 5'-phosphate oxidase family protein
MTALDDVIAALRDSPAFHVATVDEENKPRSRPFNLVFEYNGHLTFGTGSGKKFYAQLQKNPNIEISSFVPAKGEWIRVHGKVVWTEDLAAKEKVFVTAPDLKALYGGPESPILKPFWIHGVADFYNFGSPAPIKSIPLP